MTANDLRETIAAHFRAPDRQAVIQALVRFPNFFEGWFTAETLFALQSRWPAAELVSNANYGEFAKPDIVFLNGDFRAVLAVKHIATRHRDAQSRWDGAKGSTVAKDIEKLRAARAHGVFRRVVVFYGPAHRVAHKPGSTCDRNRLSCIACSIAHLSAELVTAGRDRVAEPEVVTLVEDDRFHLLDFAL